MRLNLFKSSRGNSIVTVAIALVVLMGSTAAAVDVGYLYSEKAKLQTAADAAALAGAQVLPIPGDADEETAENSAKARAEEYFGFNASEDEITYITVSNYTEYSKAIKVEAERKAEMFFAKVIGFNLINIYAKSTAIKASIIGVAGGARPFGVVYREDFTLGEQIVLKENAGDDYRGCFGALSLGRSGGDNYRENIKNGYPGEIHIYQPDNPCNDCKIPLEGGNMPGPSKQGVDYVVDLCKSQCGSDPACTYETYKPDCPRVIFIPFIDSISNPDKTAKVITFGAFFLEAFESKGGHSEVTGRFIEYRTSGKVDPEKKGYGLTGTKLVD